jgi:non-homologous end joining protein Ku
MASKPSSAWRGAVEFAGFQVNVTLYRRRKNQRNENFKQLAPSGAAMESACLDPVSGELFDRDDIRKAVVVGRGKDATYVPMTEEAMEQINSGVKAEIVKADRYVPTADLDLAIAIASYTVRPDDKVPGAASSVNTLWNGLRHTRRAYVTQASLTGGHDSIVAFYVDDRDEFRAVQLPFEVELYETPEFEFTEDEEQAEAVALFLEKKAGPFEHDRYVSEYKARRQAAIDAVVSGAELPVAAEPAPTTNEVPDLMAVLKGALEETRANPKSKAKSKAKDKVTA